MQPQQNNNLQNQPPITPNGQPASPPPPPLSANQPPPPPQQQYSSNQGQQSAVVGPSQQGSTPAGPSAAAPQQPPASYQNAPQAPTTSPQPNGQMPAMGQSQPGQQPMQQQPQQPQGFNQQQSQQFSPPPPQQPSGMGQSGPGFSYPVDEKPGSKLKKILLISGGALIALVSLSVGLFVAFGGGSVTYDELSRAETSSTSSENISILHPVEMEEVFLGTSRLEFRHSDEESQGMISELSVEGIFYGASFLTDEVLDELVDGLLDSDSELYREYVDAIEEEMDRRTNLNIGDFRRLELKDGKSAQVALVANMEFELPLATDQDQYVPAKGKMLFILGEETMFLVGLQAIEEVFDANEDVFREIVKSIQVE